jgi:hypothetical protein
MSLMQFVIPGLTRNYSGFPLEAGMTTFVMINVAIYR